MYKIFRSRRTCYARERLPRSEAVTFSPPPSLNINHLTTIYRAILHELESFVRPLPELMNQTISLKEKIAALRTFFFSKREVNFHEILSEAKNRAEIIISFLALLELVKQRCINVSQEHIDSHIVVSAMTITESS